MTNKEKQKFESNLPSYLAFAKGTILILAASALILTIINLFL